MSSERRSNCFVGVVFVRRDADNTPQFLLVRSTWKKYPQKPAVAKFPGGMYKSSDANFLETARREAITETGLKIKRSARLKLLDQFKLNDQRKYFYLVKENEYRGRLRKEVIEDGDDVLLAPEWVSFEELETSLYTTHRPLLERLRAIAE